MITRYIIIYNDIYDRLIFSKGVSVAKKNDNRADGAGGSSKNALHISNVAKNDRGITLKITSEKGENFICIRELPRPIRLEGRS